MTIFKKKIFLCITKSNWGGAQKYVFDIAINIPKDQFDITVILGGDGELKKKLDENGIKNIVLKNSQRNIKISKDIYLFFELIKIFKKEKPDIIHLNSSKIGFVGALAVFILNLYFKLIAKSYQLKAIFTTHGWAFNENRNFLSKIFFKILYFFIIILCHKIISVSENTKKQIYPSWMSDIQLGYLNKKIIVIKNGLKEIELKDKNFARNFLFTKILKKNKNLLNTFSEKTKWVGTISELHTNKGLNYAIEAISKIKDDIIFIIIGEGEKRKELEELIIKLGASKKVFLIGKIDSASLYLKAFDIFILSSITEALPFVLLEAGYAGLPVITSNVGGIPEIIENDKIGILISPKNSEEIKNCLNFLIKKPEKAQNLGNSLKEKILKDFTQEEMLEKTFALYK